MASTSQINQIDFKPLSRFEEQKLPTNLDVIRHVFYYTRYACPKLYCDEAYNLIIVSLERIWMKAGLKIVKKSRVKSKIQKLHDDQRDYMKSRNKTSTEFYRNSNNVFDILHDDMRALVRNHDDYLLFSLPIIEIEQRMKNLQVLNPSGIINTK